MRLDGLFWIVMVLAVAGGWLMGWAWHRRRASSDRGWPRRWNLNARPVFTADERALFNELRLALPHHVVMAKLNLLRFCQVADGHDARQWYDRLHTLHVSFAICTPNGAVVSVIDIEPRGKATSQRSQRLKEAVLEACRVRYVRCRPGHWPHAGLMAPWALGQVGQQVDAQVTGPGALHDAGNQLAHKLRERRAERAARWAESSFAQDSFFASDSRLDDVQHSESMPFQASRK
ncbi:MAG: DUF2726 domain-containing protein [Burkholderiales bacterium]|nr:DUF2726 domain-containing protein [Burkholderiales bacterium]